MSFNVRVYGILIDDGCVLVTDELIRGMAVTKFPGGGLEFGEGTRECLIREFKEELDIDIEVSGHFYTTDFFQESAFLKGDQVLSIYYMVEKTMLFSISASPDFVYFFEGKSGVYKPGEGTETFRWIPIQRLSEPDLTLPIDKIVAEQIKKLFGHLQPGFKLENNNVRLEVLNPGHFEALWQVARDTALWKYTSVNASSPEGFKTYFNSAMNGLMSGNELPFAIYDKKYGKYVGSTRFGNISEEHKRAEIGWTWYDPAVQGSGINTDCKFLMLAYGFEVKHWQRIELKTGHLNLRSQRAIEKIGAQKEGIFRNHNINENGTTRHTHYYAITIEDWPQIKATIFKEKIHQS